MERKRWKRSHSSDSDSVALMTPFTTPIFDFHLVTSHTLGHNFRKVLLVFFGLKHFLLSCP